MRRSGAQIVWEMLTREGVDVVFGLPGGAILDTYHCLQEYDIRHVLVPHEQCAAHAVAPSSAPARAHHRSLVRVRAR